MVSPPVSSPPTPESILRRSSRRRGMTLIEISLVLAVLLGLASVLLIGFKAYKDGADRANCVQNLGMVQKAVRSYSNLNENVPGDIIDDFKAQLIGAGKFIEATPSCPSNGNYTYKTTNNSGDTIPTIGDLYMKCSLDGHEPSNATSW